MKKKSYHLLTFMLIALYSTCITYAQTPGVPMFDTSGKEYIEYIPGNLPIIISAPHGGVKLTGGSVNGVSYPDNNTTNNSSQPYYLPTRSNSCGTIERDNNTDILIRRIQDEIFAQTGGYAHIIINNLNRKKLDPNREVSEATCDNANAEFFWNAWHGFIDQASASVEANWGKGIYIDLHGQSHSVPRIEVGYNISSSELNSSNLNDTPIINASTIKNLEANNLNNYNHEALVRGANSLGELFQNASGTFYANNNDPLCGLYGGSGYRALPSNSYHGSGTCDDTKPNNNSYFDGDFYNNRRHGSGSGANDGTGGGGTVDGIMTEVNRRVRDLGSPYDSYPSTLNPFAIDYAKVVLEFINIHYNDFSIFNYASNTYDTVDSDPTPSLTNGISGGIYTSTPAGLSIDQNTGVIDLSNSLVGDYIVTYSVGPIKSGNRYYNTDFNIEITSSTLYTNSLEAFDFNIFPNPTEDVINFESTKIFSRVEIYNTLGKRVTVFSLNAKKGQFNLSNLTTGVYIASFYDDENNKSIIKRIVKN